MINKKCRFTTRHKSQIINDNVDLAATQLISIAQASRLKLPSMEISEFIHDGEVNS